MSKVTIFNQHSHRFDTFGLIPYEWEYIFRKEDKIAPGTHRPYSRTYYEEHPVQKRISKFLCECGEVIEVKEEKS